LRRLAEDDNDSRFCLEVLTDKDGNVRRGAILCAERQKDIFETFSVKSLVNDSFDLG